MDLEEDRIYIPEPPDGNMIPLPGYEYIPLEEYIVAVEIRKPKQKMYTSTGFSLNQDPFNESVFT
jgi:hypothetical protein